MRIAAVADVHCPRYLDEFRTSLDTIERPEVFLLAGDMVNRGAAIEYRSIIEDIEAKLGVDIPILACYGNEEFEETRQKLDEITEHRVLFLEGEASVLDVGNATIGIIGAPSPIDRRTGTDKLGGKSIRERFQSRVDPLSALLSEFTEKTDYTILLMHYSPLVETASMEDEPVFTWLMEEATKHARPDLIIHGHAHSAGRVQANIEGTRVFNVAIPAVGKVTEIWLDL